MTTLQKELERDLALAAEAVRSAKEKSQRAPAQVVIADKILGVAQSKFRNGTGLYLEVINAGTGLQRALWEQLQAQYQVCLTNLEMARLMGTRFWE